MGSFRLITDNIDKKTGNDSMRKHAQKHLKRQILEITIFSF